MGRLGVVFSAVLLFVSLTGPSVPPAAASPSQLWWTDYQGKKIQKSNLDGTGLQDVIGSGINRPWSVALDEANGLMYWTEYDGGGIKRASLDGSGIVNISGVSAALPSGLALDLVHGRLYWTDSSGGNPIRRANLDGSGVEAIAPAGSARDIALDVAGGKVYWTNWSSGNISRANFDGSSQENLTPSDSAAYPYGIALDLDRGLMYWTESGHQRILRANLDGSNRTTFLTVPNTPVALTLDLLAGRVYWSESGIIRHASLDGTDIESFAMQPTAIYDLTIQRSVSVPEPSTLLHLVAVGLASGFAGAAGNAWRRRRKRATSPTKWLAPRDTPVT